MDTEKANMRAALEWSLSDDADAEEGLRLAAALGPYWERGGHWPEGWQWLKRTIARPGVAPGSRNWARAKRQLGSMAWWLGELEEARLHASEAQAAFEALADEAGAAGALMGRGTAAHAMGDLRGARDIYAEVLARGRSGAARMHDVTALTNLSVVCRDLGELEEARRFAEQARSLAERQGARIYLGRALRQLGVLARDAGRHDEAWELISRAATAYDEHLEPRDVVFCRLDMAAVARLRGDTAKARELYMLCEAMLAELGDRRIRAMALANLAILDREAGDLDAARRGLAESLRVTLELGARSLLASIASERAWLLVDECRPMEAARLLGAVEAVRAQTGRRLGGIELEDLQRRMAALRQRLGDEAFDEARRQGASAGLESEIGRLG
jgi:tetratricopeptide (TPR) repeat protein